MRLRSRHALVLFAVFLAAPGRGADAGGPKHPPGSDPVAPFTPWQWNQDGQPVHDEPWRQSNGPFGAMLVLTDHPDAVFEAWAKPPSPDYRPYIPTVSEARRGDTVAAMIVFARCAPDPNGRCRPLGTYQIYAVVSDRVSGRQISLLRKLRVLEAENR